MYIMCLIIYEENAEVQDQCPLSLNPVQKGDDPIQDHNRNDGPKCCLGFKMTVLHYLFFQTPRTFQKGFS